MASGTINSGKNIQFLLGTQQNLEKYIKGPSLPGGATATEGSFYLTNDTHRLYVGTASGTAVPVNEGVITVADLDTLKKVASPHAGEFYYVTAANVLCVYNGTAWVQINNNTNTYLVDTDTQITLASNVATITTYYTNQDNVVDSKLTDSWQLAVAEGVKVAVDGDKITLTGVMNDSFSATAENNIATVTLTDSFQHTEAFKIKSGNAATMTVSAEGDTVTLNVAERKNTGVAISNGNATDTEGFTVSVTDSAGTVSGSFNPAVKVGSTTTQTVTFKNGVVELPVYTKAEVDNIHLALNAMTYRGLVGATADASVPRLAWNAQKALEAEIGDTYLFAENVTIGSGSSMKVISAGSLAIARGQEDPSTGKIPAGRVIWDYVESTNNTDTKYSLTNVATTPTEAGYVQLTGNKTGAASGIESKEKVIFEDGTATEAKVSVDEQGNAHVKINHVGISATEQGKDGQPNPIAQSAASYHKGEDKSYTNTVITALESITVNPQGHITGFKTNTITLKDTNAVISEVKTTVGDATAASSITLTDSITLNDGNGIAMTAKTGKWGMQSETLVFNKKSETSIGIDLVWGSFN